MTKRVIITGGTGLIGRPLVAELEKSGREIVILSRNPSRHEGTFKGNVKLVAWDARSAEGWGELANGAEAIINLAGESIAGESFLPARWNSEQKRRIKESRLMAGKAVVEAVAAAKVKPEIVIQASAVGYYGPRGDELVTEETGPGNDFLAEVGQEWESSTAAVEEMGVRRAILRTGLVLTKEGGPLPRLLLPYKLFAGGPFGSGKQYWAWIHLDDVIKATRFVLENEAAAGPFNLTAPTPVTNRDFGKTLGRVMSRPSLIPVPGFAMRLLVGEVATVVLDGQRAVPEKLKELGYSFQFAELQAALHNIVKG